MGGRITFPLYSIYHASKWAVEGFSEALQYEVSDFNIQIKMIEPGPIKTDFYRRSSIAKKEGLTAYDGFVARAMPKYAEGRRDAPDGRLSPRLFTTPPLTTLADAISGQLKGHPYRSSTFPRDFSAAHQASCR